MSGVAAALVWVPEGYETAVAEGLLTAMVPLGQPMQWGSLMRSQAKMVGSSTSAAEKEVSVALRLVAPSSYYHLGTLTAQCFCIAAVLELQASHAQHGVI